MLSLIVAVAENGVIGGGNQLLWKLPADLKRFKETTSGHAIIMGRKTYESIGRPLPNRRNIVVTRQDLNIEGVEVVHSLEEAIAKVSEDAEAFIIGGAELYRQALPFVDRIYLTAVHQSFDGDVYFPELGSEWKEIAKEEGVLDEKNLIPHTFLILGKSV
jgi:dihydrofolate reductase